MKTHPALAAKAAASGNDLAPRTSADDRTAAATAAAQTTLAPKTKETMCSD
jgi:hypothetical protein